MKPWIFNLIILITLTVGFGLLKGCEYYITQDIESLYSQLDMEVD